MEAVLFFLVLGAVTCIVLLRGAVGADRPRVAPLNLRRFALTRRQVHFRQPMPSAIACQMPETRCGNQA